MNKHCSPLGQQLRFSNGGEFAHMECDGSATFYTTCVPVPERVAAKDFPIVRDALIASACRALGIDVPRLDEADYRGIWSAAGWNCRVGRLCSLCSKRKACANITGGLTFQEYIQAAR